MKTKFSYLMKQGGQIVICVTLAMFLLTSCEKDITSSEVGIVKQKLIVEHATLDEINKLMREAGLPEIVRKEIKESVKNRTIYPCSTWLDHGDWNGSNSFTAYDLVLARAYLCNYAGGSDPCYGSIDMFYCTGYCPTEAVDFAYLSALAGYGDGDIINDDDIDYGADLILGIITCY